MNSSVYVFGIFGGGLTLYPSDYTKEIFQKFLQHAQTESQLIIHRDNNLMYYGYVRELDVNSQYIGFCVLLNSIMFSRPKDLFEVFENAVADLVDAGIILQLNESGDIIPVVSYMGERPQEAQRISDVIKHNAEEINAIQLPPVNYGIANTSVKSVTTRSADLKISEASCQYGFTIVSKTKGSDTTGIRKSQSIIRRLNSEKRDLEKLYKELKNENLKLKAKQKNLTWVLVLASIIAVLGVILYDKVINPAEVTHYKTDEFVYYGPLKNKKPNGVGVAIYPDNDKDGRKYYIGNFVDGKRQDNEAILFYKDGDYYYGSMDGDEWKNGVIYLNSDNSYFRGSFSNNNPFYGIWYDYKERYRVINGINQ